MTKPDAELSLGALSSLLSSAAAIGFASEFDETKAMAEWVREAYTSRIPSIERIPFLAKRQR